MGRMEQEMTGATIMAVETRNGVIIGADTRTSVGTYVAGRITDKLTELSSFIYCCRSGSAADTQMIAKVVKDQLKQIKNMDNDEPTVRKAAMLAKNIIYENSGLLAGLIVAGYD